MTRHTDSSSPRSLPMAWLGAILLIAVFLLLSAPRQ